MANHHFSPLNQWAFHFLGYPWLPSNFSWSNPTKSLNLPWSNAMKSSFSQWNLQIFSSFWSVSSYFTPCFPSWTPPPMTPLKSPHKTRIQWLRGIAVHLEGIAGHGAGDGFGAGPLQRHHGAAAQLEGARGALLRDTPNEKAIFPWENVG